MAKKNRDNRGPEAFDRYFSQLYGDRWPGLRQALQSEPKPQDLLTGLRQPYFLDGASVQAAQALQVQPSDTVLDLCAAPGGKTLVLALALAGTGSLTANDRSSDRRARLHRVIADHLPPELQTNIRVTGYDATRWGLHEQNGYDKILLDAPCSSERHVLRSAPHLAEWTAHRTKVLAQQALAMLCSALEALRPGGRLVYSTCSISPEENENLMGRFALKRPNQWTKGEEVSILPDTHQGQGPLYYCVIEKKEPVEPAPSIP